MEDELSGGCLCGAVRYSIEGNPINVAQCCCIDCQKATGTGHTTIVSVRKTQLTVSGSPLTYSCRGDSGEQTIRHFCGICGSRLYTTSTLLDWIAIVQSGTLDNPNRISPEMVIYAKDAVKWDFFDPSLPKYPEMPPLDNLEP